MSLRTAPCPRCQALIVYGERKCRSCAMAFDYGADPPPEPSADAVLDVLMSVDLPPMPGATTPLSRPPAPAPAHIGVDVGTMPGLDSGRQDAVGDVEVEEIPGFIDSTLYAAWTPRTVDIATMPGLEATRQAEVTVQARMLSDIDGQPVPIGDVVTEAVPGLFGSDLFRADVDIAAGASASPSLEVTTNSRPTKRPLSSSAGRRIMCATCATIHQLSRCPSCGTAAPE